MMRCILIDDEVNALKMLRFELDRFSHEIEIVGTFTSAKKALSFIKDETVDVVFLDVEMPDMSGIEFMSSFSEPDFQVVFTTAYSRYAIDAIKHNAVDYLMKPIDFDELKVCISKLKKKMNQFNFEDKLTNAIEKLNDLDHLPKKIKIFAEGKIIFLSPDEIVYCEADGSYTHVYLKNESKLLVSQRLKIVEEWLPKMIFYRVHHSYIINIDKIKEFHRQENYVILDNHKRIPISRKKKSEIMDKL